jgi:hypothetical protein
MKTKVWLIILLMIIGATVAGMFGPWWAPAASVVLMAMLMKLPVKQSVWIGMCSLLAVFTVMSMWMSGKDDSGLISKTGALLGGLSVPIMVIVTGLIGGITGIVSGWLGSNLAKALPSKN